MGGGYILFAFESGLAEVLRVQKGRGGGTDPNVYIEIEAIWG